MIVDRCNRGLIDVRVRKLGIVRDCGPVTLPLLLGVHRVVRGYSRWLLGPPPSSAPGRADWHSARRVARNNPASLPATRPLPPTASVRLGAQRQKLVRCRIDRIPYQVLRQPTWSWQWLAGVRASRRRVLAANEPPPRETTPTPKRKERRRRRKPQPGLGCVSTSDRNAPTKETRRARIGKSLRNRSRSISNSPAVWYRCDGSGAIVLSTMVSRSRGIELSTLRGAGGCSTVFCRNRLPCSVSSNARRQVSNSYSVRPSE